MATPKYLRGDKVKIKGMTGAHTIHWPVLLWWPAIVNHRFTIEERVSYKFMNGQDVYYAWEEDLTKVEKKK